MSDMPLVSVAIPCYNHENYVQECIRSVISQDYDNIELIIIDDGSTDNSVKIIKELLPLCKQRFARFKFLHRENRGLSASLNEAIAWCRGVYFSAIASDDVMYPSKTSVLLPYLQKDKQVAGVFCGCNLINSDGVVLGILSSSNIYKFDDILLRNYQIITPSQLLRMEYIRDVGCYINDMYIEDWYMWLMLSEKGYHLQVIDELLVGYRQHGTNSCKNALKMYEGRKNILIHFKNKKNYKKSLSHVCLMAAIDFTAISKKESIVYMIEAISSSRHIVLTSLFYQNIIRILIPRFLVHWIKGSET